MDLIERGPTHLRHPWETARARAVIRILKNVLQKTATPSVLDIGCGDGYILHLLSTQITSTNLHGLDINLSPQDIATFSTPAVTLHSTSDTLSQKFDIIILMDVLEHVPQDTDFLHKIIRDHAHEKTTFLITVPAYQSLFCGHDTFLKHYRRYNPKTLLKTLRDAGLTVKEHGSLFQSLLIPRMFQCLIEKISPNKKRTYGIGQWAHGPAITTLLQSFLNFDNTLLGHINHLGIPAPGLSLWAVAKKS
jgi:2-polyprenyl-3-methyl-5-hydroxy-6-metoxy-1,4-benzoquinol methylase